MTLTDALHWSHVRFWPLESGRFSHFLVSRMTAIDESGRLA